MKERKAMRPIAPMTKDEILETASDIFKSKIAWVNWIGVPPKHRFMTQCESNVRFTGADYLAQLKDYTLDIFVWYKDKVTDADFLDEQKFEDAVRCMGEFSKEYGYNNSDMLFYAHYMFSMSESMPEFEGE